MVLVFETGSLTITLVQLKTRPELGSACLYLWVLEIKKWVSMPGYRSFHDKHWHFVGWFCFVWGLDAEDWAQTLILRVKVAGYMFRHQRIVFESQFSSATVGLDSGLQAWMASIICWAIRLALISFVKTGSHSMPQSNLALNMLCNMMTFEHLIPQKSYHSLLGTGIIGVSEPPLVAWSLLFVLFCGETGSSVAHWLWTCFIAEDGLGLLIVLTHHLSVRMADVPCLAEVKVCECLKRFMLRSAFAFAFLEIMRLRIRILRRTIPVSVPEMLFRGRRSWRGTTRKAGKPLAAGPTALSTDRKNTKNFLSLKGLTKWLTVTKGEMKGRDVTKCHHHILQTRSRLTVAMFNPLHLQVLIKCIQTSPGPQRRTRSPSSHTRSPEKSTVILFRTD